MEEDKNSLLSVEESSYGEHYKQHLFEQYKLYLGSIERTSDRRQSANNYFLTINSLLITVVGLASQLDNIFQELLIPLCVSVIGLVTCVIFWFLIRSYKQLNSGKFAVLHEIEQELPLALYQYEWKVLGSGNDKTIYFPFSHVELLIPLCLGIIYVIVIVFLLLFSL